ncbi:MAG: DNA-protecting protein DprA [Rhodopseudomonas palustris]|nr:DNA-protecting protein DprA [Rhodopseudomonas palustris]
MEALAVVGTRQPTSYGVTMTRAITEGLVDENILIVSGLARGIDGIAHETALAHGGKTIAVLDRRHRRLLSQRKCAIYEEMKLHQLIVSEYPHHHEPHKDNFPWRNRIIAGLADAVFVSEAKRRSGTLITVGYALYLGKDVYALPHLANVDSTATASSRTGRP